MPQQTVSGVHSIKSGSYAILGMNIGMSIGMLYAFWADFNNPGKFISYLFLGLLVGFVLVVLSEERYPMHRLNF